MRTSRTAKKKRRRIRARDVVLVVFLVPVVLLAVHHMILGIRRAQIDCSMGTEVTIDGISPITIASINGDDSKYYVDYAWVTFGNQHAWFWGGRVVPKGEVYDPEKYPGFDVELGVGESVEYEGVGTFTLVSSGSFFQAIVFHHTKQNATFCYIPEQ